MNLASPPPVYIVCLPCPCRHVRSVAPCAQCSPLMLTAVYFKVVCTHSAQPQSTEIGVYACGGLFFFFYSFFI